ncbi:hypothetical protein RHODOSMS8_01825 [Rhodobiaceae bacterium]|nr:hypothetical protein RHODOSMS8_01825 [Rhodobiaceae bacterium]
MANGSEAEAEILRNREDAKAAQARPSIAETARGVIELHPASVERYLEALTSLSSGRLDLENDEAVAVLRELGSAVVITPAEHSLDIVVEFF